MGREGAAQSLEASREALAAVDPWDEGGIENGAGAA